MWDKVIKGLSTATGVAAGLLGEWNIMLTLLTIAIVVDYVSGLIVVWAGKSPKAGAVVCRPQSGFWDC